MKYLFIASLIFLIQGCTPVRAFEKEYLLDPLMEDSALTSLNSTFVPSIQNFYERLTGSGTGSSSTSCPTCGG